MNKPIYTCRCTTIESFREWISCGEQDAEDRFWITEENVIGNISGIERYNVKAAYGTSGHSIIEDPSRYKTNTGYQVEDFIFTDAQAAPMIRFRSEHPLMTREISLAKAYETQHFTLIITGSTDHMEGNHLRDTKFKFSSFDVADFMDSVQYKLYLDMAGMDIFYYDFFRVDGFQTIEDCSKAKIHDCESMMLKRYDSMDTDIKSILQEFADFIVFKGMEKHLAITGPKYKKIIAGDYRLKKLIA